MSIINNSEEVYRLLLESSTEGILICNQYGDIVKVNDRLCEMFGYHQKELINQKLELLLPLSLKNSHKKLRNNYMNSPKKRSMGVGRDLKGLRKDGVEIPIEISLNYAHLNDDLYVMALISDISERKKQEKQIKQLNENLEKKVEERTQALLESERLYRLISQNFPNGTINVLDEDLNYIFTEGQELHKLNLKKEELKGTSYLSWLDEKVAASIANKLTSVFQGGIVSFTIENKGNFYKINAVPLLKENDKTSQILVVEQNITKEKQLEIQMLEALEKEKELNDLKSRFVSMASHEFKTPLSTILSSTNLIKKYNELKKYDKELKHLDKIERSVNLLTHMINDVLSLSKIEEGQIEINREKINLTKLIATIDEDLFFNIDQSLNISIPDDALIFTDKKLLTTILINLLSNAIKYSSQDVSCMVEINSQTIDILIEDKGIGIPKEDQNKLFSRFFRASNVTNIQGTGLGLNIVYGYVDLLKGKILINSEENKGTTVRLIIPNNANL